MLLSWAEDQFSSQRAKGSAVSPQPPQDLAQELENRLPLEPTTASRTLPEQWRVFSTLSVAGPGSPSWPESGRPLCPARSLMVTAGLDSHQILGPPPAASQALRLGHTMAMSLVSTRYTQAHVAGCLQMASRPVSQCSCETCSRGSLPETPWGVTHSQLDFRGGIAVRPLTSTLESAGHKLYIAGSEGPHSGCPGCFCSSLLGSPSPRLRVILN